MLLLDDDDDGRAASDVGEDGAEDAGDTLR